MPKAKNIIGIKEYARERANGASQRQAYLSAFPNSKKWKVSTVDSEASRLERENEDFRKYYDEYIIQAEEDARSDARLKRKDILARLEAIIERAKEGPFKGADAIKAIELYCKICGYDIQKDKDDSKEKGGVIFIPQISPPEIRNDNMGAST